MTGSAGGRHGRPSHSDTMQSDRKPVFVQTVDGIGLWPPDFVALVRDEVAGRLEVTAADGTVAHRPGPLAAFDGSPWVEVAPGMRGHPALARREGRFLVFPGGTRVLSPVRISRPVEGEPPHALPGCTFAAEEVLFLRVEDEHGGARVGFLVRPSRFTAEERSLFSVPMPVARGQARKEAEAAWVRRGGGVGHEPLCMFANYLHPVQRVVEAFDQEMEGW